MDKVKKYIDANKDRFISELFDLLRIPSISAQSEHRPDMTRCAEWLAAALVKAGADHAEVFPTEGNPVVYAEKTVDPKAKTVLVYGHYDVMPVDPRSEWRTEPFEPVIRDGRIWGRGADDDKGQLWMHAKAFEAMCAEECLPCNVKFMLEGEEEIGSPSLYKFCEQNKKMLKADIILVSDTSMISMQTPSITCGLRGLAYMEVEVTGPDKDLHSGLFGGAVANPANVLTRLVAQLVDAEGRVTIPGFYDDVRELTPAERKAFNKAPFSLAAYKKSLSIGDVEGEVVDINFRSTKVRAVDNSIYILTNSTVSSATINNATLRNKRLYRFTLGVTYDTTRPQLEKLMADLDAMLKASPDTYEDTAFVRMTGFGDSSINLMVSAYLRTADLGVFLRMQNDLNLNIMDVMKADGVDFAFPSTTVYLAKEN